LVGHSDIVIILLSIQSAYDNGTILISEITVMANNVNYDGIISARYAFSSNQIFVTTTKIGVGLSDGYLVESTIEIKYYI